MTVDFRICGSSQPQLTPLTSANYEMRSRCDLVRANERSPGTFSTQHGQC